MLKCRSPPFFVQKMKFKNFGQIRRISQMTDDHKYIYVRGQKIYVSDEIYKAYKKQINHEAHLNRLNRKHKVYGFEDYKLDLNSIVDENVDIEKIIETKMLIEDLYHALDSLNDEERKLIEALYFEDKTLAEVAKREDTNPMKISRLRNKILEKLRKLLDK